MSTEASINLPEDNSATSETRIELSSEVSTPTSSTTLQALSEREIKQCWVCLQTEDEKGAENDWVRPCRCRGSSKYVHQSCIQMWIDEKKKFNSNAKVVCPQCQTEYILIFPPFSGFVLILERYDGFLLHAAPYAFGTMLLGSVYWVALSYGAITVLQVMGLQEGKTTLEQADPFTLLAFLPSIPLFLVLGRFISWQDQVLKIWRRHHRHIPFLSRILGSPPPGTVERAERMLNHRDLFSHPLYWYRQVSGALLLPTVSSFIGKYLFPGIASNLQRTMLGGLTFVVAKGLLKIYLRQQRYIQQSNRSILDYFENSSSATIINHNSTQTEVNDDNLY